MLPGLTCVILAAGRSARFGSNKLLAPMDGGTLLARALRACAGFPIVAVCSPQTAAAVPPQAAEIVLNTQPELGMTHSLQLANARIDPARAIAVLPADLALVEPHHVQLLAARAGDADVLYPLRGDGTPGHPVIFSARAREGIAALPPGDTIRLLRDSAQLRRATIAIEEAWPFEDVDAPR